MSRMFNFAEEEKEKVSDPMLRNPAAHRNEGQSLYGRISGGANGLQNVLQ